jgi:type IV secretory pathway VirB4 component
LLYGKTEGSTPFRFSLHVGDVGHTLIVGPTGAGKSVLLALMAMQFRRYDNAQVFAFDFGGSIRAAAHRDGRRLARSWRRADRRAATSVSLQPLARIDDLAERAWAAEWLAAILRAKASRSRPQVKEHLWTALTSLASAPVEERTLTGLRRAAAVHELKQALAPYCVGGPYGQLLDAEAERLGEARMCRRSRPRACRNRIGAALLCPICSTASKDRLDGSPTLIIIDEGWLALDSPAFAGQLREWLKTLRKKNASVIFATQSLADIEAAASRRPSSRAARRGSSCPTSAPSSRRSRRSIAASASMTARSRSSPGDAQARLLLPVARGNRLFELGLGEVALAFTAASSKPTSFRIAELVAEHGRAGFAAAWLRHRGVAWAADLFPNPQSHSPSPNGPT